MTAGWANETLLAIAFRAFVFRHSAHATTAANLAVLASWTWKSTAAAQPALLTHAFHLTFRSRDTLALATAHSFNGVWTHFLTCSSPRTLIAKAFGLETLPFSVPDQQAFPLA